MPDKESCLYCKQPISGQALYTLNRIAQKKNYCSWPCLATALDPETVNKLLQGKRKERLKIGRRGGNTRLHEGVESNKTEARYVKQ